MNLVKSVLAAMLVSVFTSLVLAQDKVVTNKEVVMHPDGSYSVIEYPVGQEVTVNLLPSATLNGAKGMARVVRSTDGTKVYFDVSGLPTTTTSYYTYAVDPTGTPTLLGPLTVTNGVARAEFTTPMDKFMLVVSPAEGLTGVTADNVLFTSEVPSGYAIVPRRVVEGPVTAIAGSTLVKYDVPLLNVPSFGHDAKTVVLHWREGELKGLDAKAHIHRHDGEPTTVRMEFNDLKKVPAGKRFVLWTYSPDGQYTRLGQVYNFKNRDEATIDAKTTLDNFGLLMTVEDTEVTLPTSRIYSVFTVSP
jgi:hypothetical protein